MTKIDWKVRFKNPIFWFNTVIAIVSPVLMYDNLILSDFTQWDKVIQVTVGAFKNPYVLGLIFVSLWNNIINPTTKGIGD